MGNVSLSARDVCEFLTPIGVTPKQFAGWLERGHVTPPRPGGGGKGRHRWFLFVRGSEVARGKSEWLADRRVPFGQFVSFSGPQGSGKSLIAKDMAACATKGMPMPGCGKSVPPFDVMYLTSEDAGWQVVELVELQGGDAGRLLIYDLADDGAGRELLDLLDYLGEVEGEINRLGVRLVVIDALNSFVGGDIRSDAQARRTLSGRLQSHARRTGACVIGIRNEGRGVEGPASAKALGAVSLGHVARCNMNTYFVPDPPGGSDNQSPAFRYELQFEKVSDAPPPKPLRYNIEDRSGGKPEHAHRRVVLWEVERNERVVNRLREKVAGNGSGGAPPHTSNGTAQAGGD